MSEIGIRRTRSRRDRSGSAASVRLAIMLALVVFPVTGCERNQPSMGSQSDAHADMHPMSEGSDAKLTPEGPGPAPASAAGGAASTTGGAAGGAPSTAGGAASTAGGAPSPDRTPGSKEESAPEPVPSSGPLLDYRRSGGFGGFRDHLVVEASGKAT